MSGKRILGVLCVVSMVGMSAGAVPQPGVAQGLDLSQLGNIVQQATNELAVQINLAGRQRMLTQKMSKEALLLALKVQPEENATRLRRTMKMFDRTLKGLMKGDDELKLVPANDPAILQRLRNVQVLWDGFWPLLEELLAGDVSTAMLVGIAESNPALLAEMNDVVKMFERAAGADTAEAAVVINLAGRQRMLTQKMLKEFLLVRLAIETHENRQRALKTMQLFGDTLQALVKGDAKQGIPAPPNEQLQQQLQKVQELWSRYSAMLRKGLQDADVDLAALDALSLQTLQEMNRAVKMYEEAW